VIWIVSVKSSQVLSTKIYLQTSDHVQDLTQEINAINKVFFSICLSTDILIIPQGSVTEHIYETLVKLYTDLEDSALRNRVLQCLGRTLFCRNPIHLIFARVPFPGLPNSNDPGLFCYLDGPNFLF
jgi:hypothetical protein